MTRHIFNHWHNDLGRVFPGILDTVLPQEEQKPTMVNMTEEDQKTGLWTTVSKRLVDEMSSSASIIPSDAPKNVSKYCCRMYIRDGLSNVDDREMVWGKGGRRHESQTVRTPMEPLELQTCRV